MPPPPSLSPPPSLRPTTTAATETTAITATVITAVTATATAAAADGGGMYGVPWTRAASSASPLAATGPASQIRPLSRAFRPDRA
eukprot:3411058-Rhodomonas_salina.3